MAMMTGTACARNLPQHFNGCTCAPALGAVTAEVDVDLTAADDWRDQQVVVEGRSFTLGDVYGGRLFHGSPHEISDGDTLEAGRSGTNFKQSSQDAVSITSGADIAHHWAKDAADGRPFYVYEVEPAGPVQVWRAMLANYGKSVRLQEGRVSSARVVRRIDLTDAALYERALMHGSDPLQRTDGAAR
jgi:hypothetical protein